METHTYPVYYVGGYVRDSILGIRSKDVDLAVEAPSYDALREYVQATSKIYLESPEHFTIRAKHPTYGDVDFVLCRKDGMYSDHRRPDTVSIGTIYDDLARRDFTVNAIARNAETGEMLDPYNGQEDIKYGLLRCVGNPYERFNEDPLRILRALRFSLTKDFVIARDTKDAINELALLAALEEDWGIFASVADERVMAELERMFAFDTLGTLAILQQFPDVRDFCFSRSVSLMPTMKTRSRTR